MPPRPSRDRPDLGDLPLVRQQDGVVARRQLRAAGFAEHDVRRLLRRRELVVVHPGVYVDHTGALSWRQRAVAAVLWSGPESCLRGSSALRAWGDRTTVPEREDAPVLVAVPRGARVRSVPGTVVRQRAGLAARRVDLVPAREDYPGAVLEAARGLSEVDTVAVLAAAVGSRRTTAAVLAEAVAARPRLQRRALVCEVLADLREGTCSVLEHAYLTRVERPHGLPVATRQAAERSRGAAVYRDASYGTVVVELDGRQHAEDPVQREADLARDLAAAVDGRETLRLSYRQVVTEPCATAASVGAVLRRHGWRGRPVPCGPDCAVQRPAATGRQQDAAQAGGVPLRPAPAARGRGSGGRRAE